MIKVAKTAKEKVEMLMKEEGFNPSIDYVRVGVKSGGCSGHQFSIKVIDFVDFYIINSPIPCPIIVVIVVELNKNL